MNINKKHHHVRTVPKFNRNIATIPVTHTKMTIHSAGSEDIRCIVAFYGFASMPTQILNFMGFFSIKKVVQLYMAVHSPGSDYIRHSL